MEGLPASRLGAPSAAEWGVVAAVVAQMRAGLEQPVGAGWTGALSSAAVQGLETVPHPVSRGVFGSDSDVAAAETLPFAGLCTHGPTPHRVTWLARYP